MEPFSACHAMPWFVFMPLFGFVAFSALVITIIKVWAICKIFSKAGYSWALGLLMFVPVVNIIMFLVLAFSDWPISKEIRQLKQQQNQPTI
jgi:hypothetical protein